MASLTQLPSILSLSTPFPGFFWKSSCVLVKILRSSPGLNRNSALKLWNNIQFVLHKVAPLGIGFQEVFISTSCIEIDVTRQTTSPQIWNYHRLITHWISSGETKRVSKSLRDEEEGSSVPSLGSVTWIWTQTPATACCSLTWVSRAFVEKESQACSQPDLARSQHPLCSNCSHPIKSTSHQISRLSQTLSTPKVLNRSHWSCAIDDDDVSHHCDVFIVCSFYSCLSIQLFFFSLINKYDPKCSDFPSHLMISSAICYSPPKTL